MNFLVLTFTLASAPGDYPNAQAAHEQIVSLPIYPALRDAEVERIGDALAKLGARSEMTVAGSHG